MKNSGKLRILFLYAKKKPFFEIKQVCGLGT